MTWKLNRANGDVIDPRGNVVGNLGEPPYKIPDDIQDWAETDFRSMSMAEVDTDTLADLAQLWVGDVEVLNQ